MNENMNRDTILRDLFNSIKSHGEMNNLMDTTSDGKHYIFIEGELFDFDIFIEITNKPYVKSKKSATYYPVDQASPEEDEIGGNFDFYISNIECHDKEGNEIDCSNVFNNEIVNKIEQSLNFNTDEFIEDNDDLYESKKIQITEQDILYMVKSAVRILKEEHKM